MIIDIATLSQNIYIQNNLFFIDAGVYRVPLLPSEQPKTKLTHYITPMLQAYPIEGTCVIKQVLLEADTPKNLDKLEQKLYATLASAGCCDIFRFLRSKLKINNKYCLDFSLIGASDK